jgi:hypothetical protein
MNDTPFENGGDRMEERACLKNELPGDTLLWGTKI